MLIPISTVCIWTGLGDENKYEVGDAGGTAEPLNYTLNVYFLMTVVLHIQIYRTILIMVLV